VLLVYNSIMIVALAISLALTAVSLVWWWRTSEFNKKSVRFVEPI